MKNNFSTILLVALLVTIPLIIFSTLNQHNVRQQAEASKLSTTTPIDRETPVTPSFFPLQTCPSCVSDTIAPVGGGTTPMVSEAPTESISAAPTVSQAPCDNSVQDTAHHKHHHKHQGAISGGMSELLKMIIDLINKIIAMLGGSPISMPESGSDEPSISGAPSVSEAPNQPEEEPEQQNPCQGSGDAPETTTAPSTSATNPGTTTNPSEGPALPSGTASISGAAGDTCTSLAKTPNAPVTGYTLTQCEDFTNGLGAFSGYDGGGDGTVVGGGRKASQCSATGGMLTLTQTADGSTCGGSMDSFGQKYGYWEVRMKTNSTGSGGSAPHPVLILWPDTAWNDGELDFFETDLGESGSEVYLHCVGNPSSNCYNTKLDVDYTQWHVYGFEWTVAGFTGFIDGKQVYTTDGKGSNPSVNMHQTIQLDNLSGKTPVSPGIMQVDWVHMYKKG